MCTSKTAVPPSNFDWLPINMRSTSSLAQFEPLFGPELNPIQVFLLAPFKYWQENAPIAVLYHSTSFFPALAPKPIATPFLFACVSAPIAIPFGALELAPLPIAIEESSEAILAVPIAIEVEPVA